MRLEREYTKKLLMKISILTLVIVAAYSYLFYQIRTQTKESVTLLETLKNDVSQRDRFENIEETLANLEDRAEDIESIVLDENNIVSFLEDIESLGSELGLTLSKTIQQKQIANGSIISITIKTEGNWRATQNFVALLENLPYSISMERYSGRVLDAGIWLGSIEFSVNSNS